MTEVTSREAAIDVLNGKVVLGKASEDVPCKACGKTIAFNERTIAVKTESGKRVIGPFCAWLCKGDLDDRALKLALSET
ncbi:MAG: hypothetical protein NT041_01005 [Candidatus Vogelbacteria bacterium]|nr:hypothetical protein [Candidatus Vogelbacteria bacterium]